MTVQQRPGQCLSDQASADSRFTNNHSSEVPSRPTSGGSDRESCCALFSPSQLLTIHSGLLCPPPPCRQSPQKFPLSTTHAQLPFFFLTITITLTTSLRRAATLTQLLIPPLAPQRHPHNTASTSFCLRFQTASSCKHRHILNTRPPPAELAYCKTAVVLSV